MDTLQLKLLFSLAIILFAGLGIFFAKKAIHDYTILKSIEFNRRKVIVNLSLFVIYMLSIILLSIIWAIDFKQITVLFSSVLAILGIALFAQWSIFSNLTASVVLFFYHPVRIGDKIRILDSSFEWVGRITDMTGFYFFMKTDKGENITLPNNLVIQKGIEILETKSNTNTGFFDDSEFT